MVRLPPDLERAAARARAGECPPSLLAALDVGTTALLGTRIRRPNLHQPEASVIARVVALTESLDRHYCGGWEL